MTEKGKIWRQAKMKKNIDVYNELKEKGNKAAENIAILTLKDISLLQHVLDGATSSNKRVKNAAAKTLKIISAKEPQMLYPKFDFFVDLIKGEDTILKWIAIDVIGNLSYVDTENKIDKKILKKFYKLLSDEVMITSGHSIDNLWKIALNKPRYQKEITAHLLEVDSIERNEECRRILAGKVILAFTQYFDLIDDKNKEKILSYAKGHLNSSRHATKNKAKTFLQKFKRIFT